MNSKQIHFNSFLNEKYFPEKRSAQGWIVIIGFVLLSIASYFSGSTLRLIFPVTAFLVAIFLYLRHPILYLGFNWWIWFLTPLITRLVDYRVGWDPTRQMIVAPYLVTLVSIGTLIRNIPNAYRTGGLPFLMGIASVFYALLVGLIRNQPMTAARALLDWSTPVIFGFHLFMSWRDYPSYRQNIRRTFLWGVLITGAYGIFQFVVAPEWDRYWLIQSKQFTSSGNPVPFGMRVWSTMHSIGPFAGMMQAGLLLLFTLSGPLTFPASAVGYLSFLLTQARTNWGGWALGLVMIFGSVKPRIQMRLILIILVMALCVVPLTTYEPISKSISNRLQTFSNLEQDNSFQGRSAIYQRDLELALSQGLGKGLGSTWVIDEKGDLQVIVIDSGVLDTFFTLGWFGAIPYLGALILLTVMVSQYSEARFDSFASAARAIAISCLPQMIMGSAMLSISGLILWGFFGITMAAHKYYQHNGRE
ncbi:O-antigen ligase family protein [Aetokthonos hydrillicola Thurmond2011]|uniref:O-antigen ligase family protein n=1 Tax=Aetokthonos hydrillicola Thurmond2011 TaxID=2712845 RepID=A0AAP5ICQ8_9CYAN|nr:O-antigen ligase family protein [Aetokthonos hydrillicola]MBO3461306.1 O-antigen ligase domain-containing protein [Aetokthonos hydrillicola CCALA 1050]MBW4589644.1 O-antigen ligase family protein [Aetokthonos hydrillicola CCALA 1050]MDR9899141.1 O-antigen ligase family protein [Aetokthonos hydrillicola Thurmond2011]